MKNLKQLFLLLLIVFTCVSCDEDEPVSDNQTEDNQTDDDETGGNENRTYAEAVQQYEELEKRMSGIGLTRPETFPTSGVVTYKGFYYGDRDNDDTQTSETTILYVADITFTLDFSTGNYTGNLSNFTTDLPGFEHPQGTPQISGAVRGTDDLGSDEFGLGLSIQKTSLSEGERAADFDGTTRTKGRFHGLSAEFAWIFIGSTFDWTEGPDTGTTTGTGGFMFVEAVD